MPSSIKFCLIAEKLGNIYPKFYPTMEWDTAAGHAVVNLVGGKVIDMQGVELQYGKKGFKNSFFVAHSKCINTELFVPEM